MRASHVISRLRNEVAQHGYLGLGKKICNKILLFLFYSTSSVWYERKLHEPIVHFIPDLSVTTEYLIQDKIRLVEWLRVNKETYPWIYIEKEVESALKHDHLFLILLHQEQIIGYVKIGIGPTYIHDFEQTIEFKTGTAFVYDTFTLPEHRGKNLALFALNRAGEYLKERKFYRIVCHIEKWNVPSIKIFKKAGFRDIDSIRFTRLARLSFFIRGGCIPFINLENYLNRLTANEKA